MKRQFWFRKKIMILLFIIVACVAFSAIVMGLWNAILVEVLGVKAISFVQALGILVLSKILFGGFRGGGGWGAHRRGRWMEMQEKMATMTPEEREKFKAEWRNRCGHRWGPGTPNATSATE